MRIHTWGHTYIKTSTVQDQYGQDSESQLLSYYQLNGFNGHFLLQSFSTKLRQAAAAGSSQCVIRNSEKCFQNKSKIYNLTQMFIVSLAKCGDIQMNPGPSNIHRKRINKIRYPCTSCQRGIRRRPVICYLCQNLTHSKCIKGLTNDLYDKFYNDNEVIVYKCTHCAANSVLNNIQVNNMSVSAPLPLSLPSTKCTSSLTTDAPSNRGTIRADGELVLPTLLTTAINAFTQEKMPEICKCCQKVIKKSNKKRSCNKCENIYHPKCYKTVSINDHLCNIFLSE